MCDEQDWDDYDSDDEDVEYPHTWHWQWEEYTSELTSKLELVMDDDGIEGALVAQSKLLANNLNNSVYIDRGGNPHAEDDSRPICATKFGVFAKHHLEVVRQSLVAHGSKCYHNNNNIDANDPLLPSYIICREDAHFWVFIELGIIISGMTPSQFFEQKRSDLINSVIAAIDAVDNIDAAAKTDLDAFVNSIISQAVDSEDSLGLASGTLFDCLVKEMDKSTTLEALGHYKELREKLGLAKLAPIRERFERVRKVINSPISSPEQFDANYFTSRFQKIATSLNGLLRGDSVNKNKRQLFTGRIVLSLDDFKLTASVPSANRHQTKQRATLFNTY